MRHDFVVASERGSPRHGGGLGRRSVIDGCPGVALHARYARLAPGLLTETRFAGCIQPRANRSSTAISLCGVVLARSRPPNRAPFPPPTPFKIRASAYFPRSYPRVEDGVRPRQGLFAGGCQPKWQRNGWQRNGRGFPFDPLARTFLCLTRCSITPHWRRNGTRTFLPEGGRNWAFRPERTIASLVTCICH